MQPIHLAIGVVEGFITAGVINYVRAARPELLESIVQSRPLSSEIKVKNIVLAILFIATVTGGLVSWFALIHRLDPRTKVIATFTFIVTVVSFPKYEVAGLIPFFYSPP